MTDWSSSVVSGTPKAPWEAMPAAVRARIEDEIGPVTSVEVKHSGFSPGVAAVVSRADGGQAFVKAADEDAFPISASMHREEARILQAVDGIREIPRLLAAIEESGWMVLILEAVAGRHPHLPWRVEELDHVLEALAGLASRLTPAPRELPLIGERLASAFDGWRRLRDDPTALAGFGLAWPSAEIQRLAEIEEGWVDAAVGETLLHGDLRADQILVSEDGLHVVDWPHACVGAAWVDPLFLFPSVELQGGPAVGDLVRRCEQTGSVPQDKLTSVAVAMTGYFLHRSTLPAPPGLPTVRGFQYAQGEVMVRWLETVLDRS